MHLLALDAFWPEDLQLGVLDDPRPVVMHLLALGPFWRLKQHNKENEMTSRNAPSGARRFLAMLGATAGVHYVTGRNAPSGARCFLAT